MPSTTITHSKKNKRPPFSWTQPVCPECWVGLKLKTGREAPFLVPSFCCFCRSDISEGKAYAIRINPGTVPYPTLRKDPDADE